MVPLSTLIVAADCKCLLSDVFSFGEPICFGSLEFITDSFGGLSLSLIGDGSGATIMGSSHGGTPSPLQAMTEDSVEGFHTASNGEGRIDLPFPRRHDVGASTAPGTTIPWSETTLTSITMMTIPPRQEAPQHEPPLEEERILMIDYALVQGWGKGEAPTASSEGGWAAANALNASPPHTTDGMDKLYYQLAEIHTIATAQLAESAHWHHSDSTPSLV
jgi:hypothetical protein